MSEQELRDALVRLAEPADPRPGAAAEINAAARRRHRRRTGTALLAAAAVLAVGVGALAVWNPFPGEDRSTVVQQDDEQWQQIADGPLSARQGEVAVWTGEEMVVFGGDDGEPCPPNAGCVGIEGTRWFTDGAAYDPETDTWRPIADLPFPMAVGQATVVGDEVVVTGAPARRRDGDRFALAWSPDDDTWRRLPDPPLPAFHQRAAEDRLVIWREGSRPGRPAGWVLDEGLSRWVAMPADPFDRSAFNRSIVWSGSEFLLTAVPPEKGDGETYLFARLTPGDTAWQVLPRTPVRAEMSGWEWFDGRLVNPGYGDAAGVWAPDSGEWSAGAELPLGEDTPTGCQMRYDGSAGDWLAHGDILLSLDPERALVVPACDDYEEVHTTVWTGEEFLTWGAISDGYRRNVAVGLRWAPPKP